MKKKKKILLGILVMMLLSIGSVWQPKAVSAADTIIGDDYPAKWKKYPVNSEIPDSWGMYVRQCTSFVANRLSVANKFNIPRPPGNWNANVWGANARSLGYKVDMNPKRGSVAYWNAKYHVAWVAAVDGNRVLIEEYNYDYNGNYNSRWIDKNVVDGYIHFKDMPESPIGWYYNGSYNYYYFSNGEKAIGLQWIDGKRYHFDKNGAMYKNSWSSTDKYKYYSNEDGSLAVGFQWIGDKRYNFDKNGAMYKNAWISTDKYKYYSTEDGSLAVGFLEMENQLYIFDKNGAMYKNSWIELDNNKYYSTENGELATGEYTISGILYRFDSSGKLIVD